MGILRIINNYLSPHEWQDRRALVLEFSTHNGSKSTSCFVSVESFTEDIKLQTLKIDCDDWYNSTGDPRYLEFKVNRGALGYEIARDLKIR